MIIKILYHLDDPPVTHPVVTQAEDDKRILLATTSKLNSSLWSTRTGRGGVLEIAVTPPRL